MEFKGKIKKIDPIVHGTSSAGKEFKKLTFVVDNGEKYNNLAVFTVFNNLVDNVSAHRVGDEVEVSFNINSREYNTKWYTELSAYEVKGKAAVRAAAPQPQPIGDDTELPF
jgi:hypothetical protein